MFKEIVVRGQLAGCMVTDFSGFRCGMISAFKKLASEAPKNAASRTK